MAVSWRISSKWLRLVKIDRMIRLAQRSPISCAASSISDVAGSDDARCWRRRLYTGAIRPKPGPSRHSTSNALIVSPQLPQTGSGVNTSPQVLCVSLTEILPDFAHSVSQRSIISEVQ